MIEPTVRKRDNQRVITSPLILRLVAIIALGTAASCCPGGGWQDPETIPFDISADLTAVTSIASCDAIECWLAVGSGGTIAWTYGHLPADTIEYEVESVEVGDADLTAALTTDVAWWVIGKAGTVALSEDKGDTWQSIAPRTSADLYGITQHINEIVIVGDEVVIVRQPDGSWAEPSAPSDGWGELRGVYSDDARVYAVGLGGLAWSAADPVGEWVAEDLGVETDLVAVGELRGVSGRPDRVAAVGALGTLVTGDHDGGWAPILTGTTVDLIDVSHSKLLTAEGGVFDFRYGDLSRVDTLSPGANALHSHGLDIAVVGDDGMAQRLHKITCPR